MSSVRNRIEDGFGWWAGEVIRWRWLIIAASLVAAFCLASRIPLLNIETSTEDYLLDSDPAKIAYDAFRDQFGRDQPLLALIEPEEVFDLDFLEELVALHRELEDTVVHLAEVTSLYNVRSVYGDGDQLLVDDLLEVMPRSDAQLAELKARVLGTPSYWNSMISADGRIVVVIVEANAYSSEAQAGGALGGFDDIGDEEERPLLSGAENSEFCESVLAVIERHRRDGFEIHLTGQPLIAFALTRSMKADFPKIFGAALALISGLIVVLFRRLSPVLLAALIVVLSLVSTLGISELIGIPVSLPTQVLPTFLLAVGVGYAVHLMAIFFRTLGESQDLAASLDFTLRHVGLPILMTGVTTAAGLLSFMAAEMDQVMDLGVLGAIGVMVTQFYALVLLPAMFAVLPFRVSTARGPSGGNLFLTACASTSIRYPKSIVAGVLVLALLSLVLLPGLDYSADPIEYFPDDHWLRRATLFADDRIEGMQSLEILVDTERENGLHEPEVLVALEGLRTLMADLASEGEKVGRTTSLLEVVKETHQALNENRPEFYDLPTERRVIAQELLLFENSGSDDLEDLVDSQFSKARFSVRAGWEDGVEKQRFIDRVGSRIRTSMGQLAEVELTGAVVLIARIASATSSSLRRSYTLALALITPLMMLLIGSWRAGLVSMVPNLVPILATLALMVSLGIEIDMFMLLGGCIAIGLAVDDSIHFISCFQRYLARTGDPDKAVEMTMATTGRALLFTSVILVAGFGVLSLSSMANLGNLGFMTAWAIALAFVLDVTVTPALLVLTHRR
ncbi:MAG: efflux RND transporter permease subunit [Myxococcota bacterium]